MFFIVVSRILGVYPFDKNGKFSVRSYIFFLSQLSVISCYCWFPPIRLSIEKVTSHNMLSTFIGVGSRTFYFLTPTIHAVYIFRFKSKFEKVTLFLEKGKDTWRSLYISHIGLIATVLTAYFLVEWSIIVVRVIHFPEESGHVKFLMMHHMFLIDFLIMAQYSTFANKVSVEYVNASKLAKKYLLFQALNKNNSVMENLRNMNQMYGPQLLMRITQSFIHLLSNSFWVLTKTSPYYSKTVLEKFGLVMVFIMILSELFCFCGICSQASRQAQTFNLELFKLMRENKQLCSNKKLRLYLAMKQTVTFTASGFLNLGYPLFTSIISAAATYLAILIQFSR